MDTMIRTFFRHLGESLKSLQRNGWMTIASSSAVTITLILVGVFLGVIFNVNRIVQEIEDDVNVNIYIATGTTKPEMDKLKSELEVIPNVEKVTFSGKEEQYKKLVAAMGDDWKLMDGDSNPLFDVYILSTKVDAKEDKKAVVKEVADKAKELTHVQKVDYGGLQTENLLGISKSVKLWGSIAAGLLLFVAIFIINNTIRITILSRQREIQIMRLVGARNGFIRWPFFLEGAWVGILGAIVPVLMIVLGYPIVFNLLNPQLIQSDYSMVAVKDFVPQVATLLTFIGIFIGSLGSIISMRRFLKF
ncbi:MAG: permease-like cell division protein FtsX [Streptococcaceae bacterium]|nr:permease-like cell division protein FtsX [Streptococcaceae bacterium]